MSDLIHWLFETEAVRVSPGDEPFWYTSGTIGPYYINTHFLYGGEAEAVKLLELIDQALADPLGCPARIEAETEAQYRKNAVYRAVIDLVCDYIRAHIPLSGMRFVSGGERRDWFFSLPVAKRLGLGHISIFKDGSAVLTDQGSTEARPDLAGAAVLHIADLITEASSYERAWVPAIKEAGGRITHSVVVVDRMQGGGQKLEAMGVRSHALAPIDPSLFSQALAAGRIDRSQHDMLCAYWETPRESMRAFLLAHPDFLRRALAGPEKNAARARLCLQKDPYGVAEFYQK
jgi:orotate phosphoribosyltransferase